MTATPGESWLPEDFRHPLRVELDDAVYLRPIRAEDVHIDIVAVRANRDMLWAQYGEAWGWPPENMSLEADRADLARHAEEIELHESFNYAILSGADGDPDQRLLGCVYIDPPQSGAPGACTEVSWWCVADAPDALRARIGDFVHQWIRDEWPLAATVYPFNG